MQGQRGDDPGGRRDRERQLARGHAHGGQPEPLRVGWRENEGPVPPRMHLSKRAVGVAEELPRPRRVLGDGLPSLQVRERGLDGTVTAPVKRKVVDPSAVLRILVYSLLTGKTTRSLNPQNSAGRVKELAGPGGCHFGPRPANTGEAVTSPPNMPSSAPSATITPSRRLMAITPTLRPPPCGQWRAFSSDHPAAVNPAMSYIKHTTGWLSGKISPRTLTPPES